MIAYLKLFRFPLVFTAIADSAAGYLLIRAARGSSPDPLALGLLACASAGLYFFGMALNDIADRKRDQVLAPQRVLPSGRITLIAALVACGLAALFSAGALIAVPDREPLRFLVWGGVLLSIAAYDLFLKMPPVMGLVRAGNFLLGVFCHKEAPAPFGPTDLQMHDYVPFLLLALAPLAYGTALTYVSTLEEGPTDRRKVRVGVVVMALAALLPTALRFDVRSVGGLVPAAVLITVIAVRAAGAVDKKGVMLLVRDGVAGFILLDAVQLAAAGLPLHSAAVGGLLLPAAFSVYVFKKLA